MSGHLPEFVTDGFSGRHLLIEYPEYLFLIEQRGELVREQRRLLVRNDDKIRVTDLVLSYEGSGLGVVGITSWSLLLLRRRTMRNRAVAQTP
jgi:hypothetical protein